jgi:hypothetical protein
MKKDDFQIRFLRILLFFRRVLGFLDRFLGLVVYLSFLARSSNTVVRHSTINISISLEPSNYATNFVGSQDCGVQGFT